MYNHIGLLVVFTGNCYLPVISKVGNHKQVTNDIPIGEANVNPILDSRIYELDYTDGRVRQYGLNVIAENIVP